MNEHKLKMLYSVAVLIMFLILANTMVEVNWFLQVIAGLITGYYVLKSYRALKSEKEDIN